VFDFLPDGDSNLSAFRLVGVANVSASSSGADVKTVFNSNPSYGPWSALDSDPASSWRSASWDGALGEWLEVQFTEPVDPRSITLRFAADVQPLPTRVEVTTDTASSTVPVQPTALAQRLAVPEGNTSKLRLTVRAVDGGGPGVGIAIAELAIPGVQPERTLVVPDVGAPTLIRFAVAPGYRSECLAVPNGVVCDPTHARRSEESAALDRTFTLTEPRAYEVSAMVRLLPGRFLDALLDSGDNVRASASSVDSADPRVRAGAATDGDMATAWVADIGDSTPRLSLDLGSERLVRALRIVVNGAAPVSRPTVVWVKAGDETWIGGLPPDGLIRLPWPASTDSIEITIAESERRQTISMRDRSIRRLPTGISEIRLDPSVPVEENTASIDFGCHEGLALVVDGVSMPLRVSADRSKILAGFPVRATPCGEEFVPLEAGEHRLVLSATNEAAPVALTLSGMDLASVRPSPGEVAVEDWGATSRRVYVDAASASILVVHENFNEGWTARVDGRSLEPIRVDGWQQGFVVPAGIAGVVDLSYSPQRVVVAGLTIGAAGVPGLIALAVVRPRGRSPSAVGERVVSVPVAIAVVLALGGLLTGAVGLLAIAVVLAIGGPLLGRVSARVATFVGPAVLLTAGVIVATAGSPTAMIIRASSSVVQTMCVVAVAITLVAGLPRHGADP
jgi:arabinofuranan 3-O-arabinosyltransferase